MHYGKCGIDVWLNLKCLNLAFLLIYFSKSNCCCKAFLDSNGNGAIEVNVIIIIIITIIIIKFSIMLNKPWFFFYHS